MLLTKTNYLLYKDYPRKFTKFDDSGLCLNNEVSLGDSLMLFGYPYSNSLESLTITEGIVSNLPPDLRSILTSAKMDAGSSGGLAVNKDGCMLGITSATIYGDFNNLGKMITKDVVNEFIDKYNKLHESSN